MEIKASYVAHFLIVGAVTDVGFAIADLTHIRCPGCHLCQFCDRKTF